MQPVSGRGSRLVTGWNIVRRRTPLGTLYLLQRTEVINARVVNTLAMGAVDIDTALEAFAESLTDYPQQN